MEKTYIEGTVTKVPFKAIIDHEDIPMRELDQEHVKTLTKDIGVNGLQQPLLVWNGGGDKGQRVKLGEKEYPATFLLGGAHRRAAIRHFFKTEPDTYKALFPDGVPVIVVGGTIKDALAAHLKENLMRLDMSDAQVLTIFQKMRDDHGMKQKEIAKAIGKSDAWVSRILSIEEELGEEGMEEVKKGGIKISAAREAASEMKKARKAGKPVDAKATLQKMKEKQAALKAKGKVREEKRVSAKAAWKRYIAFSSSAKPKMGEKVNILENTLGYLAGDEEYDLPEELAVEPAGKEKKGKKAAAEDESEE